MRAIVTIQHPAHVHFYRHAISELEADGHEVHVFTRDRPMAITLLDRYDIPYEVLTGAFDSTVDKVIGQLRYEINLFRAVRRLDPDVITSIGEPATAHAARLFDVELVLCTDTEHARLSNALAFPFADRIYTPDCYEDDLGTKHVRYPGYHELAYLHPNRFEPDPTVLSDVGVDPSDRFVVLRLVDWNAAHDTGDSGFTDVEDAVESLEHAGVDVYITAEGGLPDALERCRLPVEPDQVHHLLSYAELFIGESATMATESAVLGTPGIFVSTSRRGYTNELEERYGLVYNFSGATRQSDAIKRGIEIVEANDPSVWTRRRDRMLADKIDTTAFILSQLRRADGTTLPGATDHVHGENAPVFDV